MRIKDHYSQLQEKDLEYEVSYLEWIEENTPPPTQDEIDTMNKTYHNQMESKCCNF